ncbi:MAG: DNA repair protein RecN [Treponema sp.]|nr:DNA repair protein RecN [Treponema sp.]
MLEELDVKNFALIDEAHVDFSRGFTVLSGETGAGKSILIGSLAFLLGGKASAEQIRTGCHEAQVSGVFLLDGNSKDAVDWLSCRDIEAEDSRVIIRRSIKETGKSSAWIGGVAVSRADLAAFASFLVDLHGQHEQQSLMKVSEHRRYLDIYADIVDEVASFTALYNGLVEKRRTLSSLDMDEKGRRERLDVLNFALDEIDGAKLRDGEEEELEAEEARLSSFEKLCSDIGEAVRQLDGGDDGEGGVIPCMRRLNSAFDRAAESDGGLAPLAERIQSAFYELEDISSEIQKYERGLVYDPDRLVELQERLELIYRLKKKYVSQNSTVAELLDWAEAARDEAARLGGVADDKSALVAEVSELEKKVYLAAKAISAKRAAAAGRMSSEIMAVLAKLGMKSASFKVSMRVKPGDEVEQRCGPYGMDDIEFLISANPGSPLLPLERVASGGELSRVMLAMKTILSAADTAGTLIFDEIDTGIGGEVAVSLGEHMKKLSVDRQVLCITHLASIAVFADNQIKIAKAVSGNSTSTGVFPIGGQERVREIARMLSGDSDSQQSLEHAAAMLHKFGGM